MKTTTFNRNDPDAFAGLPPIIYKYRDWAIADHQKWLIGKEIYFSKSDRFNDPFDCNIPISMCDTPKDILKKKAMHMASEQHPTSFTKRKNLAEEIYLKFINKTKSEESSKSLIEMIRSMYGVCSLAFNKTSILMWAHYCRNHTGFVLGYDFKAMTKLNGLHFIMPIEYVQEIIPITYEDPVDHSHVAMKLMRTKHKVWEYENEWRIGSAEYVNRALKLNPKCIKEVILGYNFDSGELNRIKQILKTDNDLSHVLFYQIVPNFRSFQLEVVPIA